MPPFVPEFSEIGESQFIDKLMVIVERDMKPALDAMYLADNLPGLAAMTRGRLDVFLYPLLVLVIERVSSEEVRGDVDEICLSQDLTIGAGLVVDGASVELVKRKAEKYVRVFKAVIRKSILETLPATSALFNYVLRIDHQYFKHGTNGTVYTQGIEIRINIKFGEK